MNIEIIDVAKSYGRQKVLEGISFSAQKGNCIGILGCNGCGKSTLLSILAGVQRPDGGKFLCDGDDLFQNKQKRSQLVGYVPQGTPLIAELSAKDNLLLWYERKQMEHELACGFLKLLGIEDFIHVPVNKMSGGMKKRLSIGCAMAKRPPIMLLDEPTAALDMVCKKNIADYFAQYKKAGGILILATHDASELSLCDQHYIMKDGFLIPFAYNGDLEDILESL